VFTRLVVLILVAALAIGGYFYFFGWPGTREAGQRAAAAPPPEVGVSVVQPAEVPLPVEYAGRVIGVRDVEVRSLVGGILLKRGFAEGSKVTEGQRLFQIDPATYQVALERTQAQLLQAQAMQRQAEENFTRVEDLYRRGVSTDKLLDEARAMRDQARAGVRIAEAEVAAAKLNLSYTEVNAPVTGLTGLTSPAIGSLVLAQQTLLTTITPQDPAYVTFSFTDEEAQEFRRLNEARAKPIAPEDLVLDLRFGNGREYSHHGKIDTSAPRVDPQTGTIQARAIFPNPDGILLPGQFIRVRIRGITLLDAIVVPKEAVSQGPQGPRVFVVADDNDAEVRPIRLGEELADGWVVREGLKGGDRVIVDGLMRVRAGAPVRPVPVQSEKPAAKADSSPEGQRGGTRQ
jgi:membrane fusion protein (multidrug efflux system)